MSETLLSAAKPPPPPPYVLAGARRLASTPPEFSKKPPTPPGWQTLKPHMEGVINSGRMWRNSWMDHFALLESYILPRRGIFINNAQPTPNTMIRGLPINQNIVDPTGTYAMRRCAAGMMSGLMSPSRQWFKLKPALSPRERAPSDALAWFDECEDILYTIMGRSNFYESGAQMFEDLSTFGTAPMIIYEDPADLIRCYNPCCGEYGLVSSSSNRAETMWRLFVMTVQAIVEMFGIENCPADIQGMFRDKGGSLQTEKLVAHVIEPNSPVYSPSGEDGVVPGAFTWREAYWIWGGDGLYPLSLTGYLDKPHIVPRWAVTSNDAYGRSVGMDVLPDIIQLQVMTNREAEAIEKQVRPPMVASIEMKNEPMSILPGKVTFVNKLGPDVGYKPAFLVSPDLKGMEANKQALQLRIKEGFFNDLFVMLEAVGQKQMTAYEVAQRNQEKLQILGPVVERLQNEALAPAIKRIFRIADRLNLLPPAPPSLHMQQIGIEYVGVLALAQKAAKTASLERFAQTATQMAQVHQEVNDLWDPEIWLREYASDLFVNEKILRTPQQVAQLRAQRAQAQQQAQMMASLQQGAQIGKDMSQIDVGGGLNAVQLMTGLGGTGGGQQ